MTSTTSNRSGMPAIYGVVAAAEVERLKPLSELSGVAAKGEVRAQGCRFTECRSKRPAVQTNYCQPRYARKVVGMLIEAKAFRPNNQLSNKLQARANVTPMLSNVPHVEECDAC
eukprot:scaffold140302_cov22-Tisochrysis_lutea.AAC.2